MRAVDSRREYTRRFHRVIDYIDRHLDEPLALATLAEVAHFSPFHFHRLFAAWMGETLGDYVRRRRIEVAATRLSAQPRVPVLDVALSVGFGSGEAFAHAFRARFGVSASTWRRERSVRRRAKRNPDQAALSDGVDDADHPLSKEPPMQVDLVERAPVRIVYLRNVGPYGPALAEFWSRRVMPWIAERRLHGRAMYGISLDDPDVTAPDRLRYDVGVEVGDDFVAIGDEQVTTIPGGRYAATRFFGPADRIQASWESLLRDWLPESGLQLDARPTFEHYAPDMRHDDATGAFECDITIPVMPL